MDSLSEDALVLAVLFTWLDGEKQEEILRLLNIKAEDKGNENSSTTHGGSAGTSHDAG